MKSKSAAAPAKGAKDKKAKTSTTPTISKIGGGLKALLMGKGDASKGAASKKKSEPETKVKASAAPSKEVEKKSKKQAVAPQVSESKSRSESKASGKPSAPVTDAKKASHPEAAKDKGSMASQTGSSSAAASAKPAAEPTPAKKAARASVARAAGKSGLTARGSLASASEGICREVACESVATTGGYCRLHYIKNWKKIKRKEIILSEGRLNQYIEELVAKYPDKYLEAIRHDLSNDREFAKVIYDLDLDEGLDEFESESESAETVVDVRGAGGRDFEDDSEGF